MPRLNIDYSKTVIYKIVCNDINITDCYVGNTTRFTNRKYGHKYSCTTPTDKGYDYNVYQFIRTNGGWSNWSMIEIEKYPCLDSNEACKRERYHYELLGASLNKNVPSRTSKEFDKFYRDNHKEYYKNYRDEHKEKMKLYQIRYREDKQLIKMWEKLRENEPVI
jgi:hypothetical protein